MVIFPMTGRYAKYPSNKASHNIRNLYSSSDSVRESNDIF